MRPTRSDGRLFVCHIHTVSPPQLTRMHSDRWERADAHHCRYHPHSHNAHVATGTLPPEACLIYLGIFRVLLGVGVGGDYPMSASVISAII
jgi:hypothetical protein